MLKADVLDGVLKPAASQLRDVVLPGARMEHSNCFGCAPNNATGLALGMQQFENGLVSTFRIPERFASYPGVVHGGIVSTVLDEVMGNVIAVLEEKLCFTVTLKVTYLVPLHTNELYRCVAKLTRRPDANSDIYKVDGEIHPAGRDETLAVASGTYRWITVKQAATEMSVSPDAIGQYISYLNPKV